MASIEDILTIAEDIRQYVIDLPTRLLVRAGQIVIYSGLSDISESLGMIQAGEFRAGNRNDPGTFLKTAVAGSGFSGMRMLYPPVMYDLSGSDEYWNLVGIEDDVLQFGVRASDGKLVAGGGAVILDEDGITATAGEIAGWTINSDHLLSPGTPGIKIDSTGAIQTTDFVSGVTGKGWKISEAGDVEFNNAVIRGELRTTVLTYQEVQAVSGTMGVFQSAAVLLSESPTIPAVASSLDIDIKDPEYGHYQAFAVDDVLWIKDGANSTWLKVTVVSDETTYYTYTCEVLSGTTAVKYTAGQAVINYGVSGEGFLLMEAIGTGAPYFSVRTHAGAPYTATTEHVRMGNLNGNWGYSSNVYGVGIGQYAAGKSNIVIDSTGILSIKVGTTERIGLTSAGILTIKNSSGNAVFTFDASAGAEFTLPLTLASTGGIYQGTGSFASPTTGLKIWNDSGVGRIAGYNSTALQWYAGTDGKLYAGGGLVTLDAGGINLAPQTSLETGSTITWGSIASIEGYYIGITSFLHLETSSASLAVVNIVADGSEFSGTINLVSGYDGNDATLSIGVAEVTGSPVAKTTLIGSGLYVGRDESAGTGNIGFSGVLKSYKNSTEYTGYIFVPLTTPLTSTSYDGGDTVSTGTTNLDTSSVFGAPAGIKAALVQLSGVWSSANNGYYAALRPKGGSVNEMMIRAQVANINSDMTGIVPCDSNGDIDIVVGGANVTNTVIRIWGYWI